MPGRPALIAEPFEAVEEQVKRELELELLVAARADLLAIGVNTLMLAYLMYRSGLVPRLIAVLGLIGGPLVFASSAAVLFGLYEQVSVWGSIAAIPVFAWEMSLAVWLIAKGLSRRRSRPSMPGGSPEPEVARPWRRWLDSWWAGINW